MAFLKWTLGVLVALVVLLFAGGLMLSGQFQISRSIVVAAPADKIYPLVAEPKRWKEWSVWNRRDPSMAITYSGPDSGAGARWEWKSATEGDGRMTFTAAEPGKRAAYELYFPEFGTTSTGDLTLTPEGQGTRVTWSMQGSMGNNPLMRWMGLAMDRMVGPDFAGGLANLKVLAEKG